VDVQVVNQKLVRRSEDMLMQLTGRGRDEVRGALHRAEGSVKLAVMLLNGCDVAEARALLERSRGHLRAALGLIARRRTHAA
jgi:N-acetylmuramic acid 6-phosphate etherase